MARILITSGPTREYLDPVRFISNASSGRMGAALVQEALCRGHEVLLVSGPVPTQYPEGANLIQVETTEQMAAACIEQFARCDGAIAAAAPCDYRPRKPHPQKLSKTGEPLGVELIETQDIIAELGNRKKGRQWTVAFALETDDGARRAMDKLWRKKCDLIVLNDPSAIEATSIRATIIDGSGQCTAVAGQKRDLAAAIFDALSLGGLLKDASSATKH